MQEENLGVFYVEIQMTDLNAAMEFLEWFDGDGARSAEYIEEKRRMKWPEIRERIPHNRIVIWLTQGEIDQLRMHGYLISRIY